MMGFTPTFYASRPKLSEVTIDSDLDMGGRNILRVGRIDTPYMPETWPTEELDWGDVAPSEPIHSPLEGTYATEPKELFSLTTPADAGRAWHVTFKCNRPAGANGRFDVYVNGDVVANPAFNQGSTEFSFGAPASAAVRIMVEPSGFTTYVGSSTLTNTGVYFGEKTFDLSGKWLALGLDMEGLAVTVKIQGVEMPYSDYVKYFPLAPTELTFPGGWDATQIRPIVRVYK